MRLVLVIHDLKTMTFFQKRNEHFRINCEKEKWGHYLERHENNANRQSYCTLGENVFIFLNRSQAFYAKFIPRIPHDFSHSLGSGEHLRAFGMSCWSQMEQVLLAISNWLKEINRRRNWNYEIINFMFTFKNQNSEGAPPGHSQTLFLSRFHAASISVLLDETSWMCVKK